MKQLSIFDILGKKKYRITFYDFRGIRHTEEVEFSSVNDVGKWRETHKDVYFNCIERID